MTAPRPRLELCDYHYQVVADGLATMGPNAVLDILGVLYGVPPGGLDEVLILRAEAPPRYEGGRRRWVQLRVCSLCGAGAGEGPPSMS